MDKSVNPYQSPALHSTPVLKPHPSALGRITVGRLLLLAATGAAMALAFCTPLSLARDMFWIPGLGPDPLMLGFVVASTCLTGLALDRLIRTQCHCLIVGFIWAMVNAITFALLILIVPALLAATSRPEAILWAFPGALFFGSYGGVLCLHLALPISALGVWCLRRSTRMALKA
jgi:hypothetical protein